MPLRDPLKFDFKIAFAVGFFPLLAQSIKVIWKIIEFHLSFSRHVHRYFCHPIKSIVLTRDTVSATKRVISCSGSIATLCRYENE